MSNLRFKIKDEFISTTTELVSNSITVYYKEVIDSQAGTTFNNMGDGYEWADGSATYYEYGVNNYETTVPVIIFACEEDYADAYRDKFYYIGTDSIDGITYDKWQKIEIPNEMSGSSNQSWTSREKQFIYTNIIVEEVSAKLNNFGLAELTLKTANKWCTADIDVKIDSAELGNIKPEYLRSGANVFGITGEYGDAHETITIPAGIYDFRFDCGEQEVSANGITYYHCGTKYTSFGYVGSGNYCTLGTFGLGSTIEAPNNALRNSWLDYLVFVPVDHIVSKTVADEWYKVMHPYVSSRVFKTSLSFATTLSPISGLSISYEGNLNFNHLGSMTNVDDAHKSYNALQFTCGRGTMLRYGTILPDAGSSFEYAWEADANGWSGDEYRYIYFDEHNASPEALVFLITQPTSNYTIDQKFYCTGCNNYFTLPYLYYSAETGWRCEDCRYASPEPSCPNCGSTTDYGEHEGEMRCNHCYYPYSGYCDEHGYYNNYSDSVCPGCYPYQCMCDSRFATESEMEEHQVQSHNWYYCSDCGHARPYEGDGSDYSWVEHTCRDMTCNHTYGDYGSTVYVSATNEGNHTISCRYCDYETTESCSIGDDNTCTICGQSTIVGSCAICSGAIYAYDSYESVPSGLVHSSCYVNIDKYYSCPQCGASVDWTEYPYTGQCSEGHYVNRHDPEYCSHTKVNWYCSNAECGASGTYCSGWSGDSDVEASVRNGYCPNCHGPYVYS